MTLFLDSETLTTPRIDIIAPDTVQVDQYLEKKALLLEKIYSDPEHRKRILNSLLKRSENTPDIAPFGLVLGTSLAKFPEKFTTRVQIGSKLLTQGNIQYLVFSGSQDNEAPDKNQAMTAQDMAINKFGVPKDKTILVGGTNTEQNLRQAGETLSQRMKPPFEVLLVSDSIHLIRTMSAGQDILREFKITPYPYPVEGKVMLDPHDPNVCLELLKAYAYRHTLYPHPDARTIEYVRSEIDKLIYHYEILLGFRKPQSP